MGIYYIAGLAREADGSGVSVHFPDVPEVCAGGSDYPEALENAEAGLHEALRHRVCLGRPLPVPSTLEEAQNKVQAEREKLGLDFPKDTLFQYVAAPDLDMAPVRVNVSLPRVVLEDVDRKAKLAGMTRSAYLLAAVQAFRKRPTMPPRVKSTKTAKTAKDTAKRTEPGA